jgi:tol-pal system protein YbgF
MNQGERIMRRGVPSDLLRHLAPWLTAGALLTGATACIHEVGGEGQLAALQSGLDSEFPDRGPATDVDPPGAPRGEQAEASKILAPVPPMIEAPHEVAEGPSSNESASEARSLPRVDDPGSTATRPVIKIVGLSKAPASARGASDHIELTLPSEGSTVARVAPAAVGVSRETASEPSAKQEYERALALVNAHSYDRALEAFSAYLIRWPDEPGAENALDWSAECYLAKGELAEASDEFENALARFPQGSKAPDSLLGAGVCAQRLGNDEKAKTYFDRLVRDFPKSDALRRMPKGRPTPHS